MIPADGTRVISFDLQGTLSASAFSDEFWLELLPVLYAEHHKLGLNEAKASLKEHFSKVGKYHLSYYCARTWLNELAPGLTLVDLLPRLKNQALLYDDSLALVKELAGEGKRPLIMLSTTTHDFIDLELGVARSYFREVYSTLDDFGIAGKTPDTFREAARRLGVSTNQILHVGDCAEMDIKNGNEAGCRTFFFDKKEPRRAVLERLAVAIG